MTTEKKTNKTQNGSENNASHRAPETEKKAAQKGSANHNSDSKIKDVKNEMNTLAVTNAKLVTQIRELELKVMQLESQNSSNIRDFQAKAKTFQDKAQEELDKHRKAIADKFEAEKNESRKYGSQKLLEALIDPLLNIEMAVATGSRFEGPVAAYVQGFSMLLNQINNAFEDLGIKRIEPRIGEEFNPLQHHAITVDRSSGKHVIKEVKKVGYMLHDRVIQPAIVIVGS